MSNEYYSKFPYEAMNLMMYHVYREVWKPVKDESITFRLEPDNEYDKWAVAGVSGSLTVGHVPLGASMHIAEQMQHDQT